MDEGRLLARTLAIRDAIQSYKGFVKHEALLNNPVLAHKIIKIISSGYLQDMKVLEHREEGTKICEKIQASVSPEALDGLIERERGTRKEETEALGLENNGCLKILRAGAMERDRYGRLVKITVKVMKRTGSLFSARERNKKGCFKICLDYFGASGEPVGGDVQFIHESDTEMLPGEIKTLSFFTPPEVSSYRAWLGGQSDRARPVKSQAPERGIPPRKDPRQEKTDSKPAEGVRRLQGIESADLGEDLRVDISAAGPVRHYRKFFLDNPPRLVVDLPGNWETPEKTPIRVSSDLIRKIRIGRHPDKLRIVIDLLDRKGLLPVVIQESPQGLAVTFKKH
ncbi:MAG: AMIN domain-containing protein [Pseudomonadota bacterium]